MIPGLVVAVVTAVIAVNAAETTTISAAHDAGVGSARAYLSIFEEMQGGLDSDIHWEQDLLPPVSDRAWDIGVSDLKILGVVLGRDGQYAVERATQELNTVFPTGFRGEPPRNFHRPLAEQATFKVYIHHKGDVIEADRDARCAEIYLARVLPAPPQWVKSKAAGHELKSLCPPHNPPLRNPSNWSYPAGLGVTG